MSMQLPDKAHFKIGEVAKITGVKTHVLRYWETEFSQIKPEKTQTNQRVYRRKDVETLLLIKRLLYKEGFTIAGANKKIWELHRETNDESVVMDEFLSSIRDKIQALAKLVDER